jgi:hypothetical protein
MSTVRDADVVHRCGFGPECVRSSVDEGSRRVGALIEVPVGLCRPCERLTARAVRVLPRQWLQLKCSLGESRSSVVSGRRPKPGSSVPLNVGTEALMRDVVRAMHDAARLVGEQARVDVPVLPANPSSVREFRVLTSAAALVGNRVGVLAASAAGLDAARVLVVSHRRCVRQLGEDRQQERLHLPCPQCGRQSLVREVVDRRGWSSGGVGTPEVVRCLGCREEWSESEYRWLSQLVLADAKEREEQDVLRWLLAEVNHKFNEAQDKLERLERLAALEPDDLVGIDASAVVAMVREIVE